MTDALAVFHGEGSHPLSRFLKPGFRHVFAAVRHGDYWVTLDGAEGLPAIYVSGVDDLAAWYRERGYLPVAVERRGPIRSPMVIASCVGMTKAVLGIRSRALTPWALYRHLTRIRT